MMDDDLVPARMVNEYVYCPRLFYLEWVEARFADNDDTRIGRQVHRWVDTESGAAPLPGEGELRAARSVTLSSERLGVIAKLDIVEGDGDAVVPVDYKKGTPQPDGTPWPSDEVQVCLQALVLREHGYRCERAELYYAETRQRVAIELTPERISHTHDLVADARRVAAGARAPLPLVDSPKCVRCSLVGLCLPDETNALLARREQSPLRLVPRSPDQRPVYVTEPGAFVGVRGGRLEITKTSGRDKTKEKLDSFRLLDVAQLAVFGRVQVSTPGPAGVLRQVDPSAVAQHGRLAVRIRGRPTTEIRGVASPTDRRTRTGRRRPRRTHDPPARSSTAARCCAATPAVTWPARSPR